MVIWYRSHNSRRLVRNNSKTLFGNLFESSPHTSTMAENESVQDENDNQQVRTMRYYLQTP